MYNEYRNNCYLNCKQIAIAADLPRFRGYVPPSAVIVSLWVNAHLYIYIYMDEHSDGSVTALSFAKFV